jgi:DNA polymerase
LLGAQGPVWGHGDVEARVWAVGEAPGERELETRVPFTGPAGTVLDIAMRAAGVARETWWVDNVVKCMPPGKAGRGFRRPSEAEIEFCASRWLLPLLQQRQPNVVVALGDVAANALGVPRKAKITEWRGAVLPLVEAADARRDV